MKISEISNYRTLFGGLCGAAAICTGIAGALSAKHLVRFTDESIPCKFGDAPNGFAYAATHSLTRNETVIRALWRVDSPWLEPGAAERYDSLKPELRLASARNFSAWVAHENGGDLFVCNLDGYGYELGERLPVSMKYFLQSTFLKQQLHPNIIESSCEARTFTADDPIWDAECWTNPL